MAPQGSAAASAANRRAGWLALAAGIVAVSTSAPLVKAAAPAPPLTVAAVRVCLAAVILAALSGPRLGCVRRLSRREWALIAFAGALLGAHFGVWITSLYLTSTAASVALVATQPVFAGILGWLVLGDRVGRAEQLGIAFAGVGCAIIGAGASGDVLVGDLLALLGAVTVAGYLVVGRRLRGALPLLPYLAVVNAVAGVGLAVAAVIAGARFTGYGVGVIAALLGCAVVPSVVGHSLLNWCVRRVPVHLVSLGILGEPIGAAALTWIVFAEEPPVNAAIGGGVVLFGIAVGFIPWRRIRE